VIDQHFGELAERRQPLLPQLAHPVFQVIDHGPFIPVTP
jgi:hypothetical protein